MGIQVGGDDQREDQAIVDVRILIAVLGTTTTAAIQAATSSITIRTLAVQLLPAADGGVLIAVQGVRFAGMAASPRRLSSRPPLAVKTGRRLLLLLHGCDPRPRSWHATADNM